MMTELIREASSYKDPSGYILSADDKIYRVITPHGEAAYQKTRETSVIHHLIEKKWLLNETELSPQFANDIAPDAAKVLMHPKLPFISYPYEWTFSLLKAAALRHLKIAQYALERDISLIDASAYNIQFIGVEPIFIDHLSFRPYQVGEYWLAHQQFCHEFLNPLLLKAYCGVDFQALFRGTNCGITTNFINHLLPFRKKCRPGLFMNVVLPNYFDKKPKQIAIKINRKKTFQKKAYLNMLQMLENTVKKLQYSDKQHTTWQNYAKDNHYNDQEKGEKIQFIKRFVKAVKPKQLLDLGCNSGDYAIAALQAGAEYVIGIDTDLGALEKAYHRALTQKLQFLPLVIDCANPSPAQGWAGIERQSLKARGTQDAIIALALIHHLALGNNISLDAILTDWLALAPTGVIEFVPKNDPMIETMLALKGDIFPDYTYENFIQLLSQKAKIINTCKITIHGRVLVWFEKN